MNLNNPIPTEWTAYVTQTNLSLEVVPYMLWDTNTYTSTTTTDQVFFTTIRATTDLGNIKQPGMLPNPQSFLIQAIRFFNKSVTAVGTTFASQQISDVALLANTGIGTLTIGQKTYGPWPLWVLGCGNQPGGVLAGSNSNYMGYGQVQGPLYALYPNLMIAPLQNFQFNLDWPAGAVTLANTAALCINFDGQLARAVQ
jgi:hypothetical protein